MDYFQRPFPLDVAAAYIAHVKDEAVGVVQDTVMAPPGYKYHFSDTIFAFTFLSITAVPFFVVLIVFVISTSFIFATVASVPILCNQSIKSQVKRLAISCLKYGYQVLPSLVPA